MPTKQGKPDSTNKPLSYEDEVLRRMLQAPPKPHDEMKKASAKKKPAKKSAR